MAIVVSILYMTVFALSGVCVAECAFPRERRVIRIWLGLVLGLVMLIWLPALLAFLFDFTLLVQLLACALALLIGGWFYWQGRKKERLPSSLAHEWPVFAVLLPLFLFCLLLLDTHIIQEIDGSLWVGQSTYGDLSMHLGFMSSIAVQGTFPPMYSICPDTLVGYPFLSNSLGATFCLLGANLRFATILTASYAFLLVLFGAYFFFEAWLKRRGRALFATLLFFVGGGFGFAYFFDLLKANPDNLSRVLTAFYETPTNLVNYGMRWVNPIADMLVPQRALLFGWALLFACLYLLYRAAFLQERRFFLPLGIVAGALPLVHTHSFLALGIVSAYCFIRSIAKKESTKQLWGYLVYLLAVILLAGPQLLLFTFPQSTGALKLHFNWANEADNYFWFYIKNFGLIALLLPIAFISADNRNRAVFGSVIPLWLIAECIQFQPNPYDNNKLLFICFLFACGLVTDWLCETRLRLLCAPKRARIGTGVLSAVVCAALFLSGVMTLAREYVSSYQLIDHDSLMAAEYIKEHAEPDATFLTTNNHNNLVAALTGRNIVCGSGSYLYYHGVDYSERERALGYMYEAPALYFDTLSSKYDVDYVLIGSYERSRYQLDEAYFAERYPIFYENNGVVIYAVTPAP